MATIPEIKERAKTILWLDEKEDCQAVENIITHYNKKGYNGRLIENLKSSKGNTVHMTLADHPLLVIYQYFYDKYGEDDGMAYHYRWLWKVGLVSPEV